MSLFNQFETNAKKEQEGVEVEYAPNDDGSVPTFTIARAGGANQRYAKVLDRESAPYRNLININRLADDKAQKILMRTFCHACILGWRNVQDQKGQTIEFNFDNALMLMEKLPELFTDLQRRANNIALFNDEVIEGEIKN